MQKHKTPTTELDMMMLRAGWTWTRPEIEKAVGRSPRVKLQCRICHRTAAWLRRTADRIELRAQRLEQA